MQTNIPDLNFNVTTLSKQEQGEYAEIFSEGNKDLEELLLFLWSKKINTYACCSGHPAKSSHSGQEELPYIFFDISTLKQKQIEKFVKLILMQTNKSIKAKFSFDALNGERHSLSLRYTKKSTSAIKDMFELIKNALSTSAVSAEFKAWLKSTKVITEQTVNDLIQAVLKLNETSMVKYQKRKTNRTNTFGKVTFLIQDGVSIITTDNQTKTACIIKNEKDEIINNYELVKGYVIKTDEGEFLFWNSNNEIVELTSAQAKKYPLYQPNSNYCYNELFSSEKAESILNEICK